MTRKIYKNRYEFVEQKLNEILPNTPTKVVSDIGAGFGFLEKIVLNLQGIWQPFDYVRKIEKSLIWDLNQPCPHEVKTPDVVVFLEVLEHLANPQLGLENIANHAQKGSFLVLTTPNPHSSVNTLHLLLKSNLYAFQEKHLDEHHVFTPWFHIVKFFLENLGYQVIEYSAIDVEYKTEKSQNVKHFFKKLAYKFLERKNKNRVGMSYGIVAQKVK
jgi:SAM-dependent methyltransferase